MTANEYQLWAADYMGKVYNTDKALIVAALGLCGEAGEVANDIKKLYYGRFSEAETKEKILDELGDVMWYLCAVATNQHITLEEIFHHNQEKLEKRYERKYGHPRHGESSPALHSPSLGSGVHNNHGTHELLPGQCHEVLVASQSEERA